MAAGERQARAEGGGGGMGRNARGRRRGAASFPHRRERERERERRERTLRKKGISKFVGVVDRVPVRRHMSPAKHHPTALFYANSLMMLEGRSYYDEESSFPPYCNYWYVFTKLGERRTRYCAGCWYRWI